MTLLLDYLVNASWQVGVLALGALVVARLLRLTPQAQNNYWLCVLVAAAAMPLLRLDLFAAPAHRAISQSLNPTFAGRAASVAGRIGLHLTMGPWLENLVFALFGLFAFVAICRLIAAIMIASRLTRLSEPIRLPAEVSASLETFAARSGMALPPVRRSLSLSSPAVVGACFPIILLPPNFESIGTEEMCAALLHEYAHVLRRDFALTLLCEIVAIPLYWHPAVHVIRARIRTTREQACDSIAAAQMCSRADYARCLVSLARSATLQPAPATSLVQTMFGGCDLEDRVRKLVQRSPGLSLLNRNLRRVAVGLAVTATMLPIVIFHVSPLLAATPAAPAEAVADQRLAAASGRADFARLVALGKEGPGTDRAGVPHPHGGAKTVSTPLAAMAINEDSDDAIEREIDQQLRQVQDEVIQDQNDAAKAERVFQEPDVQRRIASLKNSLLQMHSRERNRIKGILEQTLVRVQAQDARLSSGGDSDSDDGDDDSDMKRLKSFR